MKCHNILSVIIALGREKGNCFSFKILCPFYSRGQTKNEKIGHLALAISWGFAYNKNKNVQKR